MEDRKYICPCYRHERDIAETGHCICHLFVGVDYQPLALESPPASVDGSPWPSIAVYGAHWCQDTVRTRGFLVRHGIPHTFIDVDSDVEAEQKVKDWNRGLLSTPTLDIQGRIVTEPSDRELAEILGLTQA